MSTPYTASAVFTRDRRSVLVAITRLEQGASPGQRLQVGEVSQWNVDTGTFERTLIKTAEDVKSIAISPDGRTIAVGYSGGITLWNRESGEQTGDLKGNGVFGSAQADEKRARDVMAQVLKIG